MGLIEAEMEAKPSWFIARDNGMCVPLIPADQLPYGIRLKGIPAQVFRNQIQDQDMIDKGILSSDGSRFVLEDDSITTRPTSVRTPPPSSIPSPTSEEGEIKQDQTPPVTQQPDRSRKTPQGPSGQKIYCSKWIERGECSFTQQGCMYKHVIPDLATLNEIGFREVPKWWREGRRKPSLRKNTPSSTGPWKKPTRLPSPANQQRGSTLMASRQVPNQQPPQKESENLIDLDFDESPQSTPPPPPSSPRLDTPRRSPVACRFRTKGSTRAPTPRASTPSGIKRVEQLDGRRFVPGNGASGGYFERCSSQKVSSPVMLDYGM